MRDVFILCSTCRLVSTNARIRSATQNDMTCGADLTRIVFLASEAGGLVRWPYHACEFRAGQGWPLTQGQFACGAWPGVSKGRRLEKHGGICDHISDVRMACLSVAVWPATGDPPREAGKPG